MKRHVAMKNLKKLFQIILFLAFCSSCNRYAEVLPAKSKASISPTQTSESVLIRINVKITIGRILYENLDANIRVNGFDLNNELQWTKDYVFTGPMDNILQVQNGFHHYTIALLNKWGVTDDQTISAAAIWNGRADGALPVTYTLGGSKIAKRLSGYVTSREVNTSSGIVYQPDSRVSYTYNFSGLLRFILHEAYNAQTSQFEETSIDIFSYEGTSVSIVKTYVDSQLDSELKYEYGVEDKITQTSYKDGGGVWTRTSATNYENSSINTSYQLSSGGSFLYAFDFRFKNIASDMTMQSGELCNQGNFTYDKNINPFCHLGYDDFNFMNWSVNNRLTEDVQYKTCAYPTIIPVSYDYIYDEDGYPIQKITTYKSGSLDGMNLKTPYHTKIDFHYE